MTVFEEVVEDVVKRLEPLVDEYIVLGKIKKEVMIKLAKGEISVVQSWSELNIETYMAKSKRMGVYTINPRDIKNDIENAVKDLSKLKESPLYAPLPEPSGKPLSETDKKILEAVETSDVSFVIEDLELNEIGDSAGMILLSSERELLKGSNGANYNMEKTKFNGYIRVFRENSSGQWSWTSTKYDVALAKNAIGLAREIAETCSKLPKESFTPGTYRVALGPMVAANLMNEVVEAANAGMVIFGMSFLIDKKPGEKIAKEGFSIKDVPLKKELPGFRGYDLEGVATNDKFIIENGIFKGYIHNSKTAKLMNTRNTGNAGWILPQAFNIEISEGDLKNEEILEVLREGYLLTNNWYTRFQNYLEGMFSTVSRDAVFRIKGGKAVGCVERVRIADLMPELLKNIEHMSRERWPIEWWEVPRPTVTPYLVFSKVKLSAPQ